MSAAPAPVAFTQEELDMLLLGLAMIAEGADAENEEEPTSAVASARARIAAILPPEPAYRPAKAHTPQQRRILGAIATETRLKLACTDGKGLATERTVRPIDLQGDRLAARCERHGDFRHSRTDRMRSVETTGTAGARVFCAGAVHGRLPLPGAMRDGVARAEIGTGRCRILRVAA